MTSHKERIEAINKKGISLPRNYFRNSHNGTLNSQIPPSEKRQHHDKTHSENNDLYQDSTSPVYHNMESDQVKFEDNNIEQLKKSLDRQPLHNSQPHMASLRTNNTSKGYLNTREQRTLSINQMLHRSQSLNALKSSEPSKVLAKSSIQQEYHDQMVQMHLRAITYGRAKRPFQIAMIMFLLFFLFFIVGLTLICLTYIYKNISFSLDKGEMIGPVIMASSFIFLGVGVKFIYDAHRIARFEHRNVAYRGYDRHYVGLKDDRNGAGIANEQLASGTTTGAGLSRIPNRKQAPHVNEDRTLGRSSQQVYGKVYNNSEL